MEREDAFDDDERVRRDAVAFAGDACVAGKVVDRTVDWLAGCERLNVFENEFGLERVGVVEVALVACVERELAEVAVVEIKGEEGCVELLGELAGEGGLAGAGTTADAEDGGADGACKGKLRHFPAASICSAMRGTTVVMRVPKRLLAWTPISMTSRW